MTGIKIRACRSIRDIPAAVWDGLADRIGAPFLAHAFLDAVESSGSACRDTGWSPMHLLATDASGKAVGAMPLYLKAHSMGEYIFDQSWAYAFEAAGGHYYPKLQAAVPFTPVGGPRLLAARTKEGAGVARTLLRGACRYAGQMGVSSLHLAFCREDEWRLGGELGMLQREGTQLHWTNPGYADFDDFLASLSSKRRHQIRRERAALRDTGVRISVLEGDDIRPGHWDAVWAFYQDTGSRKWGMPYLNRNFFERIHATMRHAAVINLAEIDGRPVAGSLSFRGADALYGRYWGCLEYLRFMHFELCYYQSIEYAIARGLKRVEAGAGGEHKAPRGYSPTPTYSLHWIVDPGLRVGVAEFLQRERPMVQMERMMQSHAYRKEGREEGA